MIVNHYAPRSNTGVADYAAALERALSRVVTVHRAGSGPGVPLYHIGNNRLHHDIYRRALSLAGVIILHDAVLHHFLLGVLSEEEYLNEFVWNYGEWHRDLARDLWRGRAASGIDPRYFRYPMLRRIVESSKAVIVHNPAAAAACRAASPTPPPIFVVPHIHEASTAPDPAVGITFRREIGVAPGATFFGIFGYLRETKRIPPSLAAFRRLHRQRPKTALLLAGDAVSPDLARLLAVEPDHPAIFRLHHLPERDFSSALGAVDCCINLRYPAAGETSGIAIRAMGAGKPVILTDIQENSDYPEETCLKVTPGASEIEELLEAMILISEYPLIAREIGFAARRHIETIHAPDRVAEMYCQVLAAAIPELAETRPIV